MSGIERIAAERRRQVEAEGWTPEHDDGHRYGHLARAAAELAAEGTDMRTEDPDGPDCWSLIRKHPDRIRQLEIAGALIAAEIDRLLRAAPEAGDDDA
jgi:hypothetical protein